MLFFALFALACSGNAEDSGGEAVDAPTIEWLVPSEGDTVTAGDVACSTIVDGFTLEDHAKHNEGAPEGYMSVSVDGAEALAGSETNFTVTLAAGAHDLTAALFYADGDAVIATDTALCDEEADDDACVPVVATVRVTAE
jgi:hypothetical protein